MTADAFPLLEQLRDALGAVDGIKTSRVGLEANMTPNDYPIARIVPSALDEGEMLGQRAADVLVYFGMPIHEFQDGLEDLYRQLFALEAKLIAAAQTALRCRYIKTITDEDRVDGYKLLALRLRVEG